MKKYIIGLLFTFVLVSTISCDSFLEATPQDKVADANFWQSESDAVKFLTNIYATTFLV